MTGGYRPWSKFNAHSWSLLNARRQRTAYSARAIEACLVEQNIPYVFIGGTKLLETAHVKDLMAALRIVANPEDEIAWMRFLRLWPGIGQAKASAIVERVLGKASLVEALRAIGTSSPEARGVLQALLAVQNDPAHAVLVAVERLSKSLEANYKKDWEQRRQDFTLVEKLAQKHQTILSFIESYLLDPMDATEIRRGSSGDVVFLITVHSGKGSERKVCYVANVSAGAYPAQRSMGSEQSIEEERRVLYVALTRAQDELIITRTTISDPCAAKFYANGGSSGIANSYFLNGLPRNIVNEEYL